MAESASHLINHHDRLTPRTLLWLGVLFGAGFYIADLLVDVYVFREG